MNVDDSQLQQLWQGYWFVGERFDSRRFHRYDTDYVFDHDNSTRHAFYQFSHSLCLQMGGGDPKPEPEKSNYTMMSEDDLSIDHKTKRQNVAYLNVCILAFLFKCKFANYMYLTYRRILKIANFISHPVCFNKNPCHSDTVNGTVIMLFHVVYIKVLW